MHHKLVSQISRTSVFHKVQVLCLLLSGLIVVLPFLPQSEAPPYEWLLFSGRFHPLVIHFPIVLLLVLLFMEAIHRLGWLEPQPLLQWLLLALTTMSSFASVMIGLALYQSGGYQGDTVSLHLWSGVAVCLLASGSWLIFWQQSLIRQLPKSNAYLMSLMAVNLLVIFASHQGGTLTHGEGFLTEHFPVKLSSEATETIVSTEEMLVFEDILRPTLDARCFSCHNENKTKGDYLMTDFSQMMAGGKSGKKAIEAGSPQESELIHRISLPQDHDDHMPPEGKTPLQEAEIRMLKWWIAGGASDTLTLADVRQDSLHYPWLAERAQQMQQMQQSRQRRTEELDGLIQLVAHEAQTFHLSRSLESNSALELSMQFPPTGFGDNDLAELQTVYPHIRKASFASSEITDDALYYVGQMGNLQELYLQHTKLLGNGLVHLQKISGLEVLDLSSTNIEDGHLLHVLKFPALKTLYLHDTAVNPVIVEAMQRNHPDLEIHWVRGTYF